MSIIINIDVMLAKRKMSVTELSEKVGLTMANISILKNGKAKRRRFACQLWIKYAKCWIANPGTYWSIRKIQQQLMNSSILH